MNRFEWIAESIKGIDASDIAAIMGEDKKRNIIDVYNEKTKKLKKISTQVDAVYFEIKLEELVAKEFALRTGKVVKKDLWQQCDKEYGFMLANIERKVNGENAILECKSVKHDEVKAFEEALRNSYLLQAQHNMRVKGADIYYIAALINTEKFIYKKFLRDEALISKIVEVEKDFWINYVQKKVKPK